MYSRFSRLPYISKVVGGAVKLEGWLWSTADKAWTDCQWAGEAVEEDPHCSARDWTRLPREGEDHWPTWDD